ncbi:MAG: MBL fold metallo-hydrolase [bacterium]
MIIKFLGTGTSHGVPMLGCLCGVCKSGYKRNKRLRSSILLSWNYKKRPKHHNFTNNSLINIVIDTTPEFRLQAIKAHIGHLDAVLITHVHSDHIYGLDDIRAFTRQRRMPVHALPNDIHDIKQCFSHLFRRTQKGGGKSRLNLNKIKGPFNLFGKKIIPIPIWHGSRKITGFRIDNTAYLTDCSRIPVKSLALLKSLDTLILSALRWNKHTTHFSLYEAIETANNISPKRTYFTHISHELDHRETQKKLPENMFMAFDGLKIPM